MKKVGPQNFFLALIDELEKQIIIKKNCWSGSIKKQNYFNIYNVAFFKKIKKNTAPVDIIIKILMIWSTVSEI